ncbi:YqzG/YhdC family protein [Caldibacillus lycopersici]|uniref:YqzG/YhdC family protein n=1 Tax=Perspicuibacillus lycopersici TaxID=1325689 RepID=A0AAE3IQX9_9BACI|nr:YqzG/YhdC family protein [Perspicuibacillus lycopersici]MCU9612557.1 YqzG/YhdC family protein [Perspicuibacillus lycopersici]
MKKILFLLLLYTLIISSPLTGHAQQDGYEKYGRIATAVVREDYPGEELVEYEYVGREKKSDDEVTDTFRFEVVENGQSKFIRVIISHHLANNKLVTLTVQEE